MIAKNGAINTLPVMNILVILYSLLVGPALVVKF